MLGFAPLSTVALSSLPEAAAAGAFTLTVSPGAVACVGQSVTLRAARNVVASPATVPIAGQSVALAVGRRITVTQATVPITGQSVTLTYTPAGAAATITVTPATVAVVGQTVDLTVVTAGAATSGGGGSGLTKAELAKYERQRKKFEEDRQRAEDELRATIRTVYRRVNGLPEPVKDVVAEARTAPVEVLPAQVEEIAAALRVVGTREAMGLAARIERNTRELERLAAEADAENDDEEAILMVLMAA